MAESVKSFSQDNNISDFKRASVMVVLYFDSFRSADVLSACATVKEAVIDSRNALFVSGKADSLTNFRKFSYSNQELELCLR